VARRSIWLGVILVVAAVVTTGVHTGNVGTRSQGDRYMPPVTPWGDPDLQGAYTNSAERSTPLERPADVGSTLTASDVARLNRQREEEEQRTQQWERPLEPPINSSRGWLVVDPPDGHVPPLTGEALARASTRAAAAAHQHDEDAPWSSMLLADRCITRGLPNSMMPLGYGNAYEIVQGPGTVAIRYEMINETRVIPLHEPSHVGANVRMYMGDPRGHFEGGTLVVDTTNFTDRTRYRGSSPNLRIIERFTPIGPTTLEWSVTFDDPATWTRPWTLAMNLTRNDERPLEYACHEGNRAVRDILGARAGRAARGASSGSGGDN
jgi:hypothetical protein